MAETDKVRNVVIRRKGNIAVPLKLTVTYMDNGMQEYYGTARIRKAGNKIKSVEPGNMIIPNIVRTNHSIILNRQILK